MRPKDFIGEGVIHTNIQAVEYFPFFSIKQLKVRQPCNSHTIGKFKAMVSCRQALPS